MEIVAIIPARFASTRFPGKPLVDIGGKSMIKRVCEQVAKSKSISSYVVATDDDRIYTHCTNEELPVLMTSDSHSSGTERVAEVAQGIQAEVVLNVQGDEPFLDPLHLDALSKLFRDPTVQIGSLMSRLDQPDEAENPNAVKVVSGLNDNALYFSRAAIPFNRKGLEPIRFRHIGIYAFRASVLAQLVKLKAAPLEQCEQLEQLRWLENGFTIRMVEVEGSAPAIDTPADLAGALRWMEQNGWEQ